MSAGLLDRLLAECGHLGPGSTDPTLDALGRAILLEDVLGITLTDEQISRDLLLDPEILRGLLPDPGSPV